MGRARGRPRQLSTQLAIQQFLHFYGAAHYYQPRRWRTRDGIIPFKRFWLEHAAIRRVMAVERLSLIQAVMLGTRLTQPIKDTTKLEALVDQQFDEAYPRTQADNAPEG